MELYRKLSDLRDKKDYAKMIKIIKEEIQKGNIKNVINDMAILTFYGDRMKLPRIIQLFLDPWSALEIIKETSDQSLIYAITKINSWKIFQPDFEKSMGSEYIISVLLLAGQKYKGEIVIDDNIEEILKQEGLI